MNRAFLYAILSVALIIASRMFSHHLLFGWSIACQVLALASLGIFALKCDKQESEDGHGHE